MAGAIRYEGVMEGFPPPPDRQVTLANWRQAPFNRWAFRHVRQILPTASVPRGEEPTLALDRAERPIEGIAFEGPDGREWTVGQALAATDTDGFILLREGRILAESYRHGLAPATPHIVFSVSKSITGLLVGIAADRGRLDPEVPLTRYIPEAAGSAYGDASLRHLLDMTVAVRFEENYLDAGGDFARYRVATGWNPPVEAIGETDLRRFLLGLAREDRPHGALYHYVSPNSDLLGWVLERATGRPYADFLAAALWQPMGAEFDGYVTVDRLGAPRAAGGICVALRDLARIGELVRRGGRVGARQVVPGWWIDDMRRNGDPEPWRRGAMAWFLPQGRYRSQWYAVGDPQGSLCAVGIHGQWIYVDPAAAIVIGKLSSQPLPVDEAADKLLLRSFDALARSLAEA